MKKKRFSYKKMYLAMVSEIREMKKRVDKIEQAQWDNIFQEHIDNKTEPQNKGFVMVRSKDGKWKEQ